MRRTPCALVLVCGQLCVGLCVLACSGGDTGPRAPAPAIGLSSATVTFSAASGTASPNSQTITVTNSGTGTLSGVAAGTIVYTSGTAGWLAASLSDSTAPATVTLTATLGALPSGTYKATLPVTAGATRVTNSPQSVSVTFTVTGSGALPMSLTSGQSASFLTSPNFNTTLSVQPGSQYLIAVVNTDPSASQVEGFSLTGTPGALAATRIAGGPASAARQPATAPQTTRRPTLSIPGRVPASMTKLQGLAQNHAAMLTRNRETYARGGNPSAAWKRARAQGRLSAQVSAAVVPTIGTVNKVYVSNSLAAGCGSVDSIGARTVAIGQHVIVLADTDLTRWPQAYRPDSSFYQTYANEYDNLTWPHLLTNIGNPLAYDASLSQLGKVTVTITPVLNHVTGVPGGAVVLAFVDGCDFFPSGSSSIGGGFSNQTEMLYSLVPDTNNISVADWEAEIRATSAHESKHIVSYADRIINNSPAFEEVWLEEGLANESSEIWMRHFNQATWLGHANFVETVPCEIDIGGLPCLNPNDDPQPQALTVSHLPFFFDYLQTESTSNREGLGLDSPSEYGAGWVFGRWATDQYANGAEGAFIKSLINEPQLTGLPNLALHTGATVPTLLTYWTLATAIFQTPGYTASDVRTTIPSFNFADIFNVGQTELNCGGTPCGLFTQSGTPAYPVQPIAFSAASAFAQTVNSVPGTSASFFLLSASGAGVETLQLLAPGGAALAASSGFRVAIIRVQ